jgi:hypothetical protein
MQIGIHLVFLITIYGTIFNFHPTIDVDSPLKSMDIFINKGNNSNIISIY